MRPFIVFCLITLAIFTAKSQFVQQGKKLVGSEATGTVLQGWAVSLSSDGNTAMVGGYYHEGGVGGVWVFTRSGSEWRQQGSELVGSGATGVASQGFSVALSSDGKTAILGGIGDNANSGAAWVFARTDSAWRQQGSKLIGLGSAGKALQGYSVSLSSDGNTAIVGAPADNNLKGAAWIFTRRGGQWTQQGNKLVGSGATEGSVYQGCSVSLAADGNTAAVGGYHDNGGAGAVWVFTRHGNAWQQQGSKITAKDAAGWALQGSSVSLSPDGNTLVFGGPSDSSGVGAAWVFIRTGGQWCQQGYKLVGNDASGASQQGSSVSLSASGNTALVGGALDSNGTGAVWVFTRTGGLWLQQGTKLVGKDAAGSAHQGVSVCMSSDGNTFLAGGHFDSTYRGATWVYRRAGTEVGEIHTGGSPEISVQQNYPNPFNPTTTIKYSLPSQSSLSAEGRAGEGSNITLKVYDLLGREVATLVNEIKLPGTYTVQWNADGLASGVYLCRLDAEGFRCVKRMLLVR